MARLFDDENFPQPVMEELRRLGADVVTAAEAGMANQAVPDEEVLTYAAAEERAVLTINRRHFVRLHSAQPGHTGIIACTLDLDFISQAARIITAIQASGNLRGQLLRVNRPV